MAAADQTRSFSACWFALLAGLWLLPGGVEAGTTIAYGSSVGATNLTSSGAPMPQGFVFQLGTFARGFEPRADNTDLWLGAWRPASDREGEPLLGSTASYQTKLLGGAFPPGMRANCFSGGVTLDHNEPPFDLGGQIYIWGYDQRATPGPAEWLLITDPAWSWPDGSYHLPATSFAVSGAGHAVLGEINGKGYEMKSAAVTVPESAADHYEGWLSRHFSDAVRSDAALEVGVWGEQADPDGDGLANLLEYFAAGDPNVGADVPVIGDPVLAGDEVVLDFRQSLSAIGVVGMIEWSVDLRGWSRQGVEQVATGEDATHATVRASWPVGGVRKAFFRLTVQRVR